MLVLNGNGHPGAAASAGQLVRHKGYVVAAVGNAPAKRPPPQRRHRRAWREALASHATWASRVTASTGCAEGLGRARRVVLGAN